MRILIRNGHVIDPANSVDAIQDVFIAEGKIVATDRRDFQPDLTIEAEGRKVVPGLIDLQARLREPGQESKGTIESEYHAAAAGGITTLCVPPDTDPVIDDPSVVELIHQRAESSASARVLTLGALTLGLEGQQLSEMAELKRAGCIGFSNANRPLSSTLVLRRALEYAASQDVTVFVQAVDASLAQEGCAHEGEISTRLGLPGIPAAAETLAVAQLLNLIEHSGTRVHFSCLSTARALQLISRARYDGLPVSTNVAVHQLHLTEMDIGFFDSHCHVIPPLRTERDRQGLREGLSRGTLNAICSDHQPHDRDAKLAPFCDTEPGISGLETLLPLSLRLVEDGVLDLSSLIAKLTCEPAGILGLETGNLGNGRPADICIYDAEKFWTAGEDTLISRGKNTPFTGWELKGKVTHTILNGKLVHQTD